MKKKILSVIFSFCLFSLISFAGVPAFPGAEGYGANTTGGRGGNVIKVTNLNDAGAGSLRAAVEALGARTVIFEVSGIIELQSNLTISNDNITIAGQTAPGDGICLKNYPLKVSANNVIIRFIRSRLGDEKDIVDDAMNGRNRSDIIIDHCTMSWSVDECASFYDNTNFTMQWCLLAESLYKSVHDKGNHGYGGIWGGKGASFHHNLLAHHTSRNPRFCGSRYSMAPDLEKIDHRNNVIFNWGGNSCYGAEGGTYNLINNYYKYGPATNVKDRIINPNAQADVAGQQPAGVWGQFYVDGNYTWGYQSTTENNWNGVDGVPSDKLDYVKLPGEQSAPAVTTYSAEEAFEHVLLYAGAIFPKRDTIDARIVMETLTGIPTYGASYGAGKGIIDTPSDVGGYPGYNSSPAPTDGDGDGMPDAWEDANSLNKADPADGKLTAANGYTNLENYLNSLVELPIALLRPLSFKADTAGGMTVKLTWEDINENEKGTIIERKSDADFEEIARIDSSFTSYTDNSISAYGSYYYRLKAYNDSVESFYTDSRLVKLTEVVGLSGISSAKIKLTLGPNPFSNASYMHFYLDRTKNVNITLYDLTGRTVNVIEQGTLLSGNYSYTIGSEGLSNGIYILKLQAGEDQYVVRLILNK